jgi:rod shape-determining protein MreB
MLKFLGASMSIDIGSAHIRLSLEDRDDVWIERSVIALYKSQGEESVLATGEDAVAMDDRVPESITVYHPFSSGKISNFDAALQLLRHFLIEVQGRLLWIAPKIRVAIHHNATKEERENYRQLLLQSGAKKVLLVNRSFACALGANIPVDEACGYMVVDIGAATTEISVLALDRVAHFARIHVGGMMINKAIASFLEKKYGVLISHFEAERIKCNHIQAVYKKNNEERIWVMGKDVLQGIPKQVEIPIWLLSRSIGPTIRLIANAIQGVLDKLPPELSSDIMRTGIVLVGGGASLNGLSSAISIVTQHPVVVPDEPEDCGIWGIWKSPLIA